MESKNIDENLSKLKQRIYELRVEKNLTQKELGQRIGFSKQAVWHWENDRTPDAAIILLLAKEFNCTASYLLGETDNPSTKILKTDYKGHTIEVEVNKDISETTLSASDVEKMLEDFKNKLLKEIKLQE